MVRSLDLIRSSVVLTLIVLLIGILRLKLLVALIRIVLNRQAKGDILRAGFPVLSLLGLWWICLHVELIVVDELGC